MQLRQDPPNITKKEFHEIQSHRIFDRGREGMVVLFSTDFCKRKCYVYVTILNSSYNYSGYGIRYHILHESKLRSDALGISSSRLNRV